MNRCDHQLAFLTKSGWADAAIVPLAGDASNRRYDRLTHPDGRRAVLMDAPPEKGEDTGPFVHIAKHLISLGLSAPEIFESDADKGFLLIEDLGDDLYARLLQAEPDKEEKLYRQAVDALITLHRAPLPEGVTVYGPQLMASLAGLAFEWYLPAADPTNKTVATGLLADLENQLSAHWPAQAVLVLRDYHAENLLWLPQRKRAAQAGQLDFQDAQAGFPAYDLVSLLEDARRDVQETTRSKMITHYLGETGADPEVFRKTLGLCGLQRNLRILGVFARLHLRDGKTHYLDFLPRVWGHLERDFAAVTDLNLGARFQDVLPAPTPAVIDRIRTA